MKISVIVVVYNAVLTISRMLDSILAQNFDDFEIVVIDDGSTDGSEEICNQYASRDARVRVFHQANSGVSAARQKGLDESNGEYIIHADADDYIEGEMLSRLYEKASAENADVVFCNYFNDSSDGIISLVRQCPPSNPRDTLKALLTNLHGSCWNKLVRRSCLSRYKVRFPEKLDYCEDLLLWVQLFQHPDISISYLDEAFYHYVSNPASITRHGSEIMLERIRLFTRRIAEILPKGDQDIDNYVKTLPIAPFQYAFQHKLVSNKEIYKEYKRLRNVIWEDAHSLRWKLGYVLIDMHMLSIARKLIKI